MEGEKMQESGVSPKVDTLALKTGIKYLFSKNLSKGERLALQTVDMCEAVIKGDPVREPIHVNYLPILQKLTDKYGKGTWKEKEGRLVLEGCDDAN